MLSRILTEERPDTVETPYIFATPDSKRINRRLSSGRNSVYQTPDIESRTRSFITTPLNPDTVHEKSGRCEPMMMSTNFIYTGWLYQF
jgi:hypothetical protein